MIIINKHVYIWVTDIEPYKNGVYILDGISFDDSYGLGDAESRSYSGNLLVVSRSESTKISGDIRLIHIARKGTLWAIETKCLIKPPCLLTSNMLIKNKYSGTVVLEPTVDAQETFREYPNGIYTINSKDFLGVVTYDEASMWLESFSDADEDITINDTVINFSESGIKAGSISIK